MWPVAAGVDLLIATPDGKTPQPDPWGLEPFFHYPQADEDFMFSVFRSFAPDADDIRVTFTHFSGLNLVTLRRVSLALVDTGMERMAARELVESAARTAWRGGRDFIEVLGGTGEVTGRLPRERIKEIRDEVWQASRANARQVAETLAAAPGLQHPRSLAEFTDAEILSPSPPAGARTTCVCTAWTSCPTGGPSFTSSPNAPRGRCRPRPNTRPASCPPWPPR